jgi:hypothetical protein
VRDRELACYRGWGVDFWQPRNGDYPAGGSGAPGAGGLSGGGNSYSVPGRTISGAPFILLFPVVDIAPDTAD